MSIFEKIFRRSNTWYVVKYYFGTGYTLYRKRCDKHYDWVVSVLYGKDGCTVYKVPSIFSDDDCNSAILLKDDRLKDKIKLFLMTNQSILDVLFQLENIQNRNKISFYNEK